MVVNVCINTSVGLHWAIRGTSRTLVAKPQLDSEQILGAATLKTSLLFGPVLPTPFSSIQNAFRYHAITQPDCVAVEHLGQSITYRELDLVSHHMALRLYELGVGTGDYVCLLTQRGIPMVAAILAVLKCGAAYVPLDGRIAKDAIVDHVVRDARPKLVVSSAFCLARISSREDVSTISMEQLFETARTLCRTTSTPKMRGNITSDSGAYIIYTSGTTGKPKGVLVTHGNVTNLLCMPPGNIGMRPGMRVAQLLNIAFDMCAWEVLGSMMNGCTLCIRGSERHCWSELLRTVDIVISTPSILTSYAPEDYPNIRVAATAGEACPQNLADKWAAQASFFNCCGPTETTIVNTVSRHVSGVSVSIGRPTPNNAVYILDDNLQPVPAGEIGVMWAGGAGVSQGYLNLPALNADRYKPDAFLGHGRMFNTGDLGRLLPDGNIEHLGRVDDQVKVKGFRVELDGIVAVISRSQHVEAAACILIDNQLVAFVAPETADIDQIKSDADAVLPYYAVPTHIEPVSSLPLTSNGKVDKVALRALISTVS